MSITTPKKNGAGPSRILRSEKGRISPGAGISPTCGERLFHTWFGGIAVKVGRNQPCPCGSGKKLKRCHGDETGCDVQMDEGIKQSDLGQIRKELMAKEKQREKQQGRGRPIISHESNGYRFVAVGSRLHYSKKWKTFHDFLFDYIITRNVASNTLLN